MPDTNKGLYEMKKKIVLLLMVSFFFSCGKPFETDIFKENSEDNVEEYDEFDMVLKRRLIGTEWEYVKRVETDGTVVTTNKGNLCFYGDGVLAIGGVRKGFWDVSDGKIEFTYSYDYCHPAEVGMYYCIYGGSNSIVKKLSSDELVYSNEFSCFYYARKY